MNIIFTNLINYNYKNIEVFKIKYLNLLKQLSIVDNLSNELFLYNIKKINNMGNIIIGITDELNDYQIVCSGTIIIEPKIIRGGKNVGHIEDIVVDEKFRGQGIAQILLNKLIEFGKENNCYKLILDCSDKNIKVYEKNGFEKKESQMVLYL